MKGKDLLKQRSGEEEEFFQEIIDAKRSVDNVKIAVVQHQDSLKNQEAKLEKLEEMTLEEWKKKNK